MVDWKRWKHSAAMLLGSSVGSLAGWAASLLVSGLGFWSILLGPLLVLAGSTVGAYVGAAFAKRKVRRWERGVAVTASAVMLVGFSLMAQLPGTADAPDAVQIWQQSEEVIAAIGAVVGLAAGEVATAGAARAAGVVPLASPLPRETQVDGAARIRAAYDILRAPMLDTNRLMAATRETLRDLDAVGHGETALAADARRVAVKLRSDISKTLLDRAWKSLAAAEQARKRQNLSAAQPAKRAEAIAREALAIADSDRDFETVRKANQCIAAARVLGSDRDPETELDDVERQVRALGEPTARPVFGREERLLRRIEGFVGLFEQNGRHELVERARRLESLVRGMTSASGAPQPATAQEDVTHAVLRVPGVVAIDKELQGGGFGRTFLCTDNLGRKLVVKTLRDEWTGSASLRKALKQESSTEGVFQHEGVPRVLGYHEIGGRPFKVMEYVSHGSLRDAMLGWSRQGYNPDGQRSVRIMREVADVLIEFQRHRHGGVHRDLKPANILLDEHGRAKLTDFGLAHVPQLLGDAVFKGNMPVGTVVYMSPEQARGETDVTPASDVYALGVILHELFTGGYPYAIEEGTPIALVREKIKRAEVTIRDPAIPAPARDLVRACLAADPADRPTLEATRDALKKLERLLEQLEFQKSSWSSGPLSSVVLDNLSVMERPRDDERAGVMQR